MKQINEYCGVFGVFNRPDASKLSYYGLHALQHRGQESCGIASVTYDKKRSRTVMPSHRGIGLVLDVFEDESILTQKLTGRSAIGHNRYSTAGAAQNKSNIQPFVVHYRRGNLALAHNGNLSNARELRKAFSDRGVLFQSTSDSELILHLISQSRRERQVDQVLDALNQCEGAFSLAILTDEALIAARDPNGFRPLALGRLEPEHPEDDPAYCIASETCAFDLIGATYVRDIEPGEVIIIDQAGCKSGTFESFRLTQHYGISPCIFEYVYFSRPDSRVFGEMVDKVRRKIGKQLAHEAPVPPVDPDGKRPIVISVPDSSNTATLGYVSECQKLGFDCRYEIGLIRNHYIGRTFISPGQNSRELKVRCKFNTVEGVLRDRTVVIVDDSIVRGTTSRFLVNMVREAGARAVHLRITSPPVRSPCFYGMDFASKGELLANNFESIDAMRDWLGVDSLAYLSDHGLVEAVAQANTVHGRNYCTACFSSNYPVPVELEVTKEENEWS